MNQKGFNILFKMAIFWQYSAKSSYVSPHTTQIIALHNWIFNVDCRMCKVDYYTNMQIAEWLIRREGCNMDT